MLRRLWYFLRRGRLARELNEEMQFHRDERARKLEQSGMSPERTRAEAKRRFGNGPLLAQESRERWGFGSLDRLGQDVRFALRRVRQRPTLALPVIVVTALGIGATTAMFSAVDAAIFRQLPFPEANRLVSLSAVSVPFEPEMGERREPGARNVDLLDAEETGLFTSVAAFASGGLNLSDPDRPLRLRVGVVSANFFTTLGIDPVLGRTFGRDEGRPTGPAVAVLSHSLWRSAFGAGDVTGQAIRLNDKPYTVIGVMPAGFGFPNQSDLWIPLSVPTTFATFEPFRGYLPSRVIARLGPGTNLDRAATRMMLAWEQRLGPEQNGLDWVDETRTQLREQGTVRSLQEELVGSRRRALLILFGATALLLLIACANVANLLLSDAAIRRREIGIREVLGAHRGRVVRQLLVESVVLALAGAGLGFALAPILLTLVGALLPEDLTGAVTARVDLRVLGFCTLAAVLTGLGFGLWPAIVGTRTDVGETIKSAGGPAVTPGRLGKVRKGLVAAEVALTTMLLIGAGLMLRSFARVMSEPSGLDPVGVVALETSFTAAQGPAERLRVINGVLERLQSQAGITAVGAVNDLPLRKGGRLLITFDADGMPRSERREMARYIAASGDYFRTLDIPLLLGRTFRSSDDSLAPRVAIVSAGMARKVWAGANPIGRVIRLSARDTTPITIVGVVGDVREASLERDPWPQMYFPVNTSPPASVAFAVRGTLEPAALMSRLTRALREVAPSQPGYNLRMMDEVISDSVRPRRANTLILALFAGLALVLSSLGVYAVVRYGASQRNREFGIRLALGARTGTLLGLIAGEMVVAVGVGLVIGLGGAWGLSRVLASLLYEVDAHDVSAFAAAPLLLLIPALLATLLPALKASRVDPTQVLRTE
ncbi:MAG: ADOP family duplicated permease [Gemmatimonadales bacterium]